MPSDPYPEGRIQKSEFGNLLPDILNLTVRPKLSELIRNDKDITNKSLLHSAFKKETGSTVSFSTFNTWLQMIGITFRKSVQIDGLTPQIEVPAPGGAVGPRPDAGEEEQMDVKFDNESPMDLRPFRGSFGDAFGEIARQQGRM